ncbi:MAG: pyroglutamyl-peptidase I [Candidatus Eisenbacteria bacterium]|nr:pyroglutamyl-peptidase I [Candidatus Eisenbacteria bacterium]
MSILISGFGPFPGFAINPSQKLVESLLAAPPAGVPLAGIILPVKYGEAPRLLLEKVAAVRPSAVVSFGVATGSDDIRLERIGINWDESTVPDGTGDTPGGRRIAPDGPDGFFSTLPLARMLAALEGHELPARISNSAGTYLCNHLMYCTLLALESGSGSGAPPGAGGSTAIPAGFVHIPPAREWNPGPTARPFAAIRGAALRVLGELA